MSSPSDDRAPDNRRERVRLHDLNLRIFPDSRCRAVVSVEWTKGRTFEGNADGTDTHQGRLQAGALAALRAITAVSRNRLALELRGVKAVRAFDAWVVIVLVYGQSEERRYRLLGSTAAPGGDLVRGSVLAVLDATNRTLEAHLDPEDA